MRFHRTRVPAEPEALIRSYRRDTVPSDSTCTRSSSETTPADNNIIRETWTHPLGRNSRPNRKHFSYLLADHTSVRETLPRLRFLPKTVEACSTACAYALRTK